MGIAVETERCNKNISKYGRELGEYNF